MAKKPNPAGPFHGPPRPTAEEIAEMKAAEEAFRASTKAAHASRVKKRGFSTNLKIANRKYLGRGSWFNPASVKGGLLYAGLPFALDAVRSYGEGLKETFGTGSQFFDGRSQVDEFLDQRQAQIDEQKVMRKRQQNLEALRQQNRLRLMQTSPHLAQSLLAGMELPTDGVVIGGQPRVDLLDQVADQMGQGAFEAPYERM